MAQPSCAALTLFANIVQHPEDPLALSDLDLIARVTSILGEMVATGRLQIAQNALWLFQELHDIARLFLASKLQTQAANIKGQGETTNKVAQIVNSIENFNLPTDFQYPNQYSQEGTFNDDLLMLMNTQEGQLYPVDMGEHFTTPDGGWYNPRDMQHEFM